MATASRRPQVKGSRVDAGSPAVPPALVPGDLAMLALDDGGVILNCSEACEQLFGYRLDELQGRHVSTLLPHLQDAELVLEDRINSRLAFLCRCATFQARRRAGDFFTSELFINRLGNQNVVVLVRSLE